MAKIKRNIRRSAMLLLATVILTFNIQVNKAQAAVLPIIAGVTLTEELLALAGAVMATGGITFGSQADLQNAVISLSYSSPEFIQKIDNMSNGKTEDGALISVSALKGLLGMVATSFLDKFAAFEEVKGGAISTANSDTAIAYYNGQPMIQVDSSYGIKYGTALNLSANAAQEMLLRNYMDYLKRYDIGKMVNGEYYAKSEILTTLEYWAEVSNDETSRERKIYRALNGGEKAFCQMFNVGTTSNFKQMYWNEPMILYTYHATTKQIRLSVYYAYKAETTAIVAGIKAGAEYVLGDANDTGLHQQNYSATATSTNILQDTADYTATVAAIGSVIGADLTDEDEIVIAIPSSGVGLTVGDVVVAGAGTGVVDPPIVEPDDPAIDEPGTNAGWLSTILSAINGLGHGIATLPGAIASSIADAISDVKGFIKSIADFFANFWDMLWQFIQSLFIVDEVYFQEKIDGYMVEINGGSEWESSFDSFDENLIKDIRTPAGISASGSMGSPTRSVNTGVVIAAMQDKTIVDFQYLKEVLDVVRPWISGFFTILLFLFNINNLIKVFGGPSLWGGIGMIVGPWSSSGDADGKRGGK